MSGADRNAEDSDELLVGKESRKWVVRNVSWLKSFIRIFLGIVWLIDGFLKFSPGLVDSFPDLVRSAGGGQPTWLQPWFNFWSSVTIGNAALVVYTTGVLEVALGLALVVGFMRKIAYLGGIIFSLFMGYSRRLRRTIRPKLHRHRNRNHLQFRIPLTRHHKHHLWPQQILLGLLSGTEISLLETAC